jgi:hypothetical protein
VHTSSRDVLVRIAQKKRHLEDDKILIDEIESKPITGNILVSIPRDAANNRMHREATLEIKLKNNTQFVRESYSPKTLRLIKEIRLLNHEPILEDIAGKAIEQHKLVILC